jgi:hypothetical protein
MRIDDDSMMPFHLKKTKSCLMTDLKQMNIVTFYKLVLRF